MKRVVADKIASVAQHNELARELRLSEEVPCEEGVLVAVEVLNNKSAYNMLELTSGRMAQVKRGDVIVGALGHREALFGYSGRIPDALEPGDTVQLLNLGGVLGLVTGADPGRGVPFDCKVLGTVLTFPFLGERVGVPARVGKRELDPSIRLDTGRVPVIAVAGTCMDSGKTAASCALVSRFRHHGLVVDAFKATGVSLRRDILAMEDAGARDTLVFTDFGVVTTTSENAPLLTKTMLSELAANKPDLLVFELGDGLLGAYGVQAILHDEEIRRSLSALVLCANDPVGAWGGVRILRDEYDIEPAAITGRATDNRVGVRIAREHLGIPAINAMTHGADLGDALLEKLGMPKSTQESATVS